MRYAGETRPFKAFKAWAAAVDAREPPTMDPLAKKRAVGPSSALVASIRQQVEAVFKQPDVANLRDYSHICFSCQRPGVRPLPLCIQSRAGIAACATIPLPYFDHAALIGLGAAHGLLAIDTQCS
jgi:hypothetical protein